MEKLLSDANDTVAIHIWNTLNDRLFEAIQVRYDVTAR